MTKMNELKRRALLGDQQAQEECTRHGILLPCPLCKKEVAHQFIKKHKEGKKGAILVIPEKSYVKCECGYSVCAVEKNTAMKIHNTRPTPPIEWHGDKTKRFDSFRSDSNPQNE